MAIEARTPAPHTETGEVPAGLSEQTLGQLAVSGTEQWRQLAACRGLDPDIFFPTRGESPQSAKAICACCPVRLPCLQDALAHPERLGIWGGLSEHERRRYRELINAGQMSMGEAAPVDLANGSDGRSDRPRSANLNA